MPHEFLDMMGRAVQRNQQQRAFGPALAMRVRARTLE